MNTGIDVELTEATLAALNKLVATVSSPESAAASSSYGFFAARGGDGAVEAQDTSLIAVVNYDKI